MSRPGLGQCPHPPSAPLLFLVGVTSLTTVPFTREEQEGGGGLLILSRTGLSLTGYFWHSFTPQSFPCQVAHFDMSAPMCRGTGPAFPLASAKSSWEVHSVWGQRALCSETKSRDSTQRTHSRRHFPAFCNESVYPGISRSPGARTG